MMTEILMMNLTPQLRKIANKKRASHPSSFREPDLDFRKLVDELEQAEITMKLEETENLKLQYVNNIQTNTTQMIKIQDSDLIYTRKIQILKVNHRSKNDVTIAKDTDTALLNADKNSKTIKINHKSTENQIYYFIST